MSRRIKVVLLSILPAIMIILCASMITYIFAATKSELLISGQIGYERPKGTGTEEDPFLIYSVGPNDGTATIGSFNFYAGNNAEGKNYFSSSSPQYYFRQENDISGSNFTQTTLLGFYDGNGYEFDASGSNKAIFSAVGSSSATTSKLEDLDVVNNNSTATAGVATNLFGTIDSVTFNGKITNSSATYIGGLVSTATKGTITNCVNNANITTTASSIGGIVGHSTSTRIMNCINNGSLTGTSGTPLSSNLYMGGIAAYAEIYIAGQCIESCVNNGVVNTTVSLSGTRYSGGIVGAGDAGSSDINYSIKNCYNTANIGSPTYHETYAGGIAGANGVVRITQCYNAGNIYGQSYAGGIAGGIVGASAITYCYNTGQIECGTGSYGNIGGIAGGATSTIGANIDYCYNLGTTKTGLATYIGGLVGNSLNGNGFYIPSASKSYYLSTCGASLDIGDNFVAQTQNRSLSQLQTQSTYSGWTFGTYGTATSGWCMVPAEILVNGATQRLVLPRLYYEDLEVIPTNTISFNAGTGSGSMGSQMVITGSTITIKPNEFTPPSNMVLDGWATTSGGAKVYEPEAEITISSNITLYAVWKTRTYTVTLDKQSGTGGTNSVNATYGSAMPSATAPTRTGYTFGGYYTGTNGTGTQYYTSTMASARTWNLTSNTTLYAKWTVQSYTITFNANGGSFGGGTYTVSSVSGASYGFALNGSGYYESQNKGVQSSAALCKVTFYATAGSTVVFTVINYAESSYDFGMLGVLDGTAMSTSYSDTSTGVTKSFSGSHSASTQTYSYSIPSTGNHYVYVKYKKDGSVDSNNDSFQFKITSGLSGATTQTATKNYGSTLGTLPTPTRSGYTLKGWYTATSGGTQVTSSTTVTGTATYYAQWNSSGYTVSAARHNSSPSSGCTYSVSNSSVASGTSVTFTATTSSGYTFQGWYTSSSSTSSSYRASTSKSYTRTITSNTTLYAYWTKNSTYDCYCSSCSNSVSSSGSYCNSCSYCSCCGGCWNHCSCTSSTCSTCGDCVNCCPYRGSHPGGGGNTCACNSCSNPVSSGSYCTTCDGDYIYCSQCGICSYHGYDYCNVAIHSGYLRLCEGCCTAC